MLSSFISHGLKESDLVTESVMQILAGAETTATVLRATLLHIITNTRVYSTLVTEIDRAVKTEKVSSPIIKDTEWRHLVYLQAVIKEGLRFWPPVTGLMTKFSPPSGDEFEINGENVFIPGGTNIGWASNGIQRNKAIFGEDVNLFRPERWLEDGDGDEDRLEKMRRVVDLNFGYGKYYCLGRLIALSELHKMIFEVSGRRGKGGVD
jgi:cytochrome P450